MDKKYWKDLNKYPPLEKEKEKEIAKRAKGGDKSARDLLINSNLRFVVQVAKEYLKKGLELEDLIAYGNLGLCKAVDKFDTEKNIKFYTYAVWWIRQAILQALTEDNHLIKIPQNQKITKHLRETVKNDLEKKYQREIYDHEIDEELGKKVDLNTLKSYNVLSLDKDINQHTDNSIINLIEDESSEDPEDFVNHESFLQELESILNDFDERSRTIIKLYYGIGQERSLTLEEIGVEFEITRERVRQIKLDVLKKLQNKSKKDRLTPYLNLIKSEILYDLYSTE